MTKHEKRPSASAAVAPFSESLGQSRQSDMFERASTGVLLCASLWLALAYGGVLAGWALADDRLIHYPADRRYGTMLPLTAVSLLLFAIALWLRRFNQRNSLGRRRVA